MLIINRKLYYQIFFSEIEIKSLKPKIYIKYNGKKPKYYIEEINNTIENNLTESLEVIFNKFKKNTQNEIRRAIKEEMKVETIKNKDEFIESYNKTAMKLNIQKITKEFLLSFGNNLSIFKVIYNNEILIYHVLIHDIKQKKVELLLSSRNYELKNLKKIENKYYSFANRFLHYKEFEMYKEKGIEIYDFGGYSETNEKLKNITKFKLDFGGEKISKQNYVSPIYYLLRKFKKGVK